MAEYLELINRPAHAAYVAAVAVPVAAGNILPAAIPFSPNYLESSPQYRDSFPHHSEPNGPPFRSGRRGVLYYLILIVEYL